MADTLAASISDSVIRHLWPVYFYGDISKGPSVMGYLFLTHS